MSVEGATRVGGAGDISIGTGDATWLARSSVVVGFRDMLEVKESSRSSEMSSKLSLRMGVEAFLVGRLGTWRNLLAVWDGKREGIADVIAGLSSVVWRVVVGLEGRIGCRRGEGMYTRESVCMKVRVEE